MRHGRSCDGLQVLASKVAVLSPGVGGWPKRLQMRAL